MAKEKSITDKVEKLFHPQNKNWRELYTSHSKAAKAAHEITREDTSNLKPEEIYDTLGKFMHTYDYNVGEALKWDDLKEFQKKTYIGKARGLLEEHARRKRVSVEDVMEEIKSKGLDKIFSTYKDDKLAEVEDHYRKSIIQENVKREDAEMWHDYVVGKDENLGKKGKHNILANIEGYVGSIMQRYHQSEISKYEKPKKK